MEDPGGLVPAEAGEVDPLDARLADLIAEYGRPQEPIAMQRMARLAAVPRVDSDTPYRLDVAAQAAVSELGGMTLEECGQAFGVSRERIRQIEGIALAKVRAAVEGAGWTAEDVLAVLARPRGRARMP